jgi:hypothetical protein
MNAKAQPNPTWRGHPDDEAHPIPDRHASNETSAVLVVANGWAGTEQLAPGAGPVVPQRNHDGVGDGRRDPPAGSCPAAGRTGVVLVDGSEVDPVPLGRRALTVGGWPDDHQEHPDGHGSCHGDCRSAGERLPCRHVGEFDADQRAG